MTDVGAGAASCLSVSRAHELQPPASSTTSVSTWWFIITKAVTKGVFWVFEHPQNFGQ